MDHLIPAFVDSRLLADLGSPDYSCGDSQQVTGDDTPDPAVFCVEDFPGFDHWIIHLIKGSTVMARLWPFFVIEYSTLGGISLYAVLLSMPSFTSSLSLDANVLVLMCLKRFASSVNLTFF
jgi:hypothetical protein